MNPIDVLHLDSGLVMRGGQWQALHLILGLRARGHRATLLCPGRSELMKAAQREGLDAQALTPGRLAGRRGLVHAHDARSHTLAALLCRGGLIVSRRVAFPVRRGVLSGWKYGRPRKFLAISRFVAGELVRAGVSRERIAIVYDGVEIPRPAVEGRDVVAIRTGDPRKGDSLAVEVARMAGYPLRWAEKLPEDLDGAGVLLYLSESEGLGSGALLAQAAGVAVIASNCGGLPEAIEDGVTGYVIENDAPRLAGILRSLIEDDSLRVRMGQAGRQRVMDRFSIERMVEATIEEYREVAG